MNFAEKKGVVLEYLLNTLLYLIKGCGITLSLYAVTIVLAIPLGILLALGKLSLGALPARIIGFYTWVVRGTPLLLQLFFVYFGLSIFGVSLTPFVAAVITYVFNYAAYFTEIYRGGIQSIDKGQYEVSKALGMSYWQMMSRVILPQTARRVLPATCNEAITLIKDTALVAIIGMGDLLRCAKELFSRDFNILPFLLAAAIYLLFTSVIVNVFGRLEKKYSVYV